MSDQNRNLDLKIDGFTFVQAPVLVRQIGGAESFAYSRHF